MASTLKDTTINPKYMPWLAYRNMTDTELQAIWLYLRSRSAVREATGNHER